MSNTYNLDYTAQDINSKLGKIEYKSLGEVYDTEEIFNNLIEEGKYRFSDGDFIYSVTVENPEDRVVAQSYWSTEEGVEHTYKRTGWLDENNEWYFSDWDCPMYSGQAYDLFASKSHYHYVSASTDNFESWINTYRSGEYRVLDSSAQKYYFVKQYGYTSALSGSLRRAQIYFEINEPWITYSRVGTAVVGNSSNITWGEWHQTG